MKAIRQAVVCARDRARVEAELTEVLGIEVSYHDPAIGFFGVENAVMPVGTTFLEVVSPVRDDATAARFLVRRGGDAGYMVLFQTDDLSDDRARFERLGIRSVWSIDLDEISASHLHPNDTGGAIVSVDEPRPKESWKWAGPGWEGKVRPERVKRVAAIELAGRDARALALKWAGMLGVGMAEVGAGAFHLALDGSSVRVVTAHEGEREGLVAIDLEVADEGRIIESANGRALPVHQDPDGVPSVVIAGTRFRMIRTSDAR
jgi:hypothetical protein